MEPVAYVFLERCMAADYKRHMCADQAEYIANTGVPDTNAAEQSLFVLKLAADSTIWG